MAGLWETFGFCFVLFCFAETGSHYGSLTANFPPSCPILLNAGELPLCCHRPMLEEQRHLGGCSGGDGSGRGKQGGAWRELGACGAAGGGSRPRARRRPLVAAGGAACRPEGSRGPPSVGPPRSGVPSALCNRTGTERRCHQPGVTQHRQECKLLFSVRWMA